MQNNAISVKQLNFYVKSLLEGDPNLVNIAVFGEISNFKNHYSSGHWYFTIKDNDAAIRCVMFKGNAQRVKINVSDGMQVVLRGRVSLFEKDGQYQFYAEEMHPLGIGDITAQFELLKAKLLAEGLFDAENKRKIPEFPKRIAVVTSETGAAVQDILNILSRRWPIAEVVLCPVAVQGELAVPQMLSTLDRVYRLSDVDIIIIGRGGGSIEDLWAFNSEELARKIYESPIPVISAVGHETDFTICDFVADLRAPTPSAAAEIAVPDVTEITHKLNSYNLTLKNLLNARFKLSAAIFKNIENSSILKNPLYLIEQKEQLLDNLSQNLKYQFENNFNNFSKNFENCVAKLDALSPLKVISRGYTVAKINDKTVASVNDLDIDDSLELILKDGTIDCLVKEIKKEKLYAKN